MNLYKDARPLMACYETLHEAFGEFLTLSMHQRKILCPCCGQLADVTLRGYVCMNGACESSMPATLSPCGKWLRISTFDLLAEGVEKYFLPLLWNATGPWIFHRDLGRKLQQYLDEKEKASHG